MARASRLLYPDANDAAAQVAAMVGTKKPRRKHVDGARVAAELNAMITAKEYAKMRPLHLVALWARCHEQVYGAAPAELAGPIWWAAASAAGKLVRDEFGGDITRAVEFMRWVWNREKAREAKARHDGDDRVSRIGWRLLFAQRYLLTDYRISLARSR